MNDIIDWELGIKLAGNKKEIAIDIIKMLAKSLPRELATMQKALEMTDYPTLFKLVHKLHGAICYCGVPRLKTIVIELDTVLKQKEYAKVAELSAKLQHEMQQVMDAVAKL